MTNINKSEIGTIIHGLEKVSDAYLDYEKRKKEIVETYRGKAVENELYVADQHTRAAIYNPISSMLTAFDSLIEQTEKGNDYDPTSSAVADAARLLSVKGVSLEAAENVARKFLGNSVALSLLHASAHESYQGIIESMMFDSIGVLNKAKAQVDALRHESIASFPSIVSSIRETMQDYAKYQGIDLGSLADSIEQLRMRNIVSLMGLNYDEI